MQLAVKRHIHIHTYATRCQTYLCNSLSNNTYRGELYPVETDLRLCDVLNTGSEVTVDMEADVLTDHSTGKTYQLKAIGDVSAVEAMV